MNRRTLELWLSACLALPLLGSGCRTHWSVVDPWLASQARAVVGQEFDDPWENELGEIPYESQDDWTVGEVILGELLAIFPGVIVHGTGHFYAGDRKTAAQLSRVGQLGYAFGALGGGLLIGGHFADEEDLHGTAYSLYGTGGLLSAVGVSYLLTAWLYDMIDTPRAVMEGGKPPPPSKFVNSLDFFD